MAWKCTSFWPGAARRSKVWRTFGVYGRVTAAADGERVFVVRQELKKD